MNRSFIEKEKTAEQFYQIPAVKKRLESENPIKGAFELAYFDTQRTLRGLGKNENRKCIKQEIFTIVSEFYNDLSVNFTYYSLRDYDGSFFITSDKIISVGKKYGFEIHFGQAQKIINMFFKYMLLVDERLNLHLNYFHVPLDGVILGGIAKRKEYGDLCSYAKTSMPWSKMEDRKTYMALQNGLREKYDAPIIFEFNVWETWNK